MFHFLTAVNYTAFFSPDTTEGKLVISALTIAAALLIDLFVVYFVKRGAFKLHAKIAACVALAFCAVVALVMLFTSGAIEVEDGAERRANTTVIAILISVIFALIAIFVIATAKKESPKQHTMSIVYAAICVAMSFGLSYIKMFRGPYGGSITLAQFLPLAVFGYMFGMSKGFLVGMVVALLQFIQGPYVLNPWQVLLDYVVPFTLVGWLCGSAYHFKKVMPAPWAAALALMIAVAARFIPHYVGGAIFWGDGMEGTSFDNVWLYSFVYNVSYILPDGLIAAAAAVAILYNKSIVRMLDDIAVKYKSRAIKRSSSAPPSVDGLGESVPVTDVEEDPIA